MIQRWLQKGFMYYLLAVGYNSRRLVSRHANGFIIFIINFLLLSFIHSVDQGSKGIIFIAVGKQMSFRS